MNKKEQQQMLMIQSFSLSGVGEEQVPSVEFKHSFPLEDPSVFVTSSPKAEGPSSYSALQIWALESPSVPVQCNALLVCLPLAVTVLPTSTVAFLESRIKQKRSAEGSWIVMLSSAEIWLALAQEVYLVNEEMKTENNNENHITG